MPYLAFLTIFWFKLNNFKTKSVITRASARQELISLKVQDMLQLFTLHISSKFRNIPIKTATCRVSLSDTWVFTFLIISAHSATGPAPKFIVSNAQPTVILCASFNLVLKKLQSVQRFRQYFQKIVQKFHFYKN